MSIIHIPKRIPKNIKNTDVKLNTEMNMHKLHIQSIGMKLYIQLLLLDNKIIKNIKIKFDEDKLNFLQIYYRKFYYSFSSHFIFISNNLELHKVKLNYCDKNINPCKKETKETPKINNIKHKYEIIILFNNNNKKINIPIVLFEFDCSKTNTDYKLLEKFTKMIEKILKNDKYLKNIINNILIS